MADSDQFIKDLFCAETAPATGNRVRFEVPPEVATRALTPDGRLTRAVASAPLALLPPPLCCLRVEALLDFKMPGDHVDRASLARAELRRWARWVTLLEEAPGARTPNAAALLDPHDFATWVVAPHWPRWIEEDMRRSTWTPPPSPRGSPIPLPAERSSPTFPRPSDKSSTHEKRSP